MAAIRRDGAASSPRRLRHLGYRPHSRADLALAEAGPLSRRSLQLSRRLAFERFGDSRDVFGGVAAAAAGNVDQPSLGKVAQITGHVVRPQIEAGFRERIRQTGIRIT